MNIDTELLNENLRYQIVAENTSDAILLVDSKGIVRYASPSIKQMTGYPAENFEGKDAFELVHPEDKDRIRTMHIGAVQSKNAIDLEYRVLHNQGSTLFVETRVKPVFDSFGNVKYIVAVVRDITARRQTEQLLENILQSINAAVWATDKDFSRQTYCSESIEKILGIPKREIMSSPIRMHDSIHPKDNEMLSGEVRSTLHMGLPVNKVVRLIHKENETRWARIIVHPYTDNKGAIERLDGMLLDITEKKRSELALEESEQRYKSLFENNLDGVFSIDLKGDFVNANQSFENITGIPMSSLPGRCLMGLIHDEDHLPIYQILSEVMQMKEPRDAECRIIRSGDGGQRIVNITFVPIFLFGELNGVHGMVKDITEKKRMELELIQSEERYKSLQQSITRFSNDLANVMKVSELEDRLIQEVRKVLPIKAVSIEKVPKGQECNNRGKNEKWMKITEKEAHLFLKIELSKPLLKVEEEWLETAVHYVTILYDNLEYIENLMNRLETMVSAKETPKWVLRLLFRLSEKERAALSSDLHDSVLQDLISWYRKLESLRSSASFNQETKGELIQIEEGILDAIHQIRTTCNELRPPFLLKMGLVESLNSLFSHARMFTNYEIDFSTDNGHIPLNEDQILGMYRIVQELLNNANKHSMASKVRMNLSSNHDYVHFSYKDNGVGMDLSGFEGAYQHMGLAGMENRVFSLEGEVKFQSAPKEGFQVDIDFPLNPK